ncbi:MAG TPA: hypothetical protein VF435_14280 [Pyrinomonadaceae bacterium]
MLVYDFPTGCFRLGNLAKTFPRPGPTDESPGEKKGLLWLAPQEHPAASRRQSGLTTQLSERLTAPLISIVMFLSSARALAAIQTGSFIFSASGSAAQKQGKDVCHVYVVDVAKSKRAFDTVRQADNEEAVEKALAAGQIIFPEFRPTIGEEELTITIGRERPERVRNFIRPAILGKR